MVGRIPITDVSPVVDLGRLPAKATVGETIPVAAAVFREGHDELGANVLLHGPDGRSRPIVRMRPAGSTPDRYEA
jgi:starch synthase (maltosyl-transferring)